VPNCLQPSLDDPKNNNTIGECLACENGYYLEKSEGSEGGVCNECFGDYAADTGCERCAATSCLECREGFNLKTVNGTGSCQPCSLEAERDKYSLFKNRAIQCDSDLTSVKYCSSGFLGSDNGDFPKLLFLNETSSVPLEKDNTCNMRCGTAQYPVVEFETVNKNANMIKAGGTRCKECAIPSCVKCAGPDRERDCQECWPGKWTALVDFKSKSGKCLGKFTLDRAQAPDTTGPKAGPGEATTTSEDLEEDGDSETPKRKPLAIENTVAMIKSNDTFKL
jgi:hypothetical protein